MIEAARAVAEKGEQIRTTRHWVKRIWWQLSKWGRAEKAPAIRAAVLRLQEQGKMPGYSIETEAELG